jgi:hypothetical protein
MELKNGRDNTNESEYETTEDYPFYNKPRHKVA